MPRRKAKTNGTKKATPSSEVGQGDVEPKQTRATRSKTKRTTAKKTPSPRKVEESPAAVAGDECLSDDNDFDMQSSPPIQRKSAARSKRTAKGKTGAQVKVELEVKVEKHSGGSKRKKSQVDDEIGGDLASKKESVVVKMEGSKADDETNKKEQTNTRKRKGTKNSESVKNVPPAKKIARKAKLHKDQDSEGTKKTKGKGGRKSAGRTKEILEDAKVDVKMEAVQPDESDMEVDNSMTGDGREGGVEETKEEEEDNGGEQVEEMSDDSSESEWEEVEDLPLDIVDPSLAAAGPSGESPRKEPVEISIDVSEGTHIWKSKRKQKREEMWRRYIQWEINRSNKELQETLHKVNLLCLLASGLQRSKLFNDMELQCIALSHIPVSMMPRNIKKVDTYYLQRFVKWFTSSFEIDAELKENNSKSMKDKLLQRLETRKTASEDEMVYVCILTLRALGLDVRLVASIHPITIKAIKLTKANKRLTKAKDKKQTPRASKTAKTSKKVPHSKIQPVCSKFFQSANDTPSSSKAQNKSGKSKKSTSPKSTTSKEKSQENMTETDNTSKQPVPSGPRPKNRQRRKCASKVKPIIELSGSEAESSSDEYKATESDSDSDYEESESKQRSATKKPKKRTKTLSDESDSDSEKVGPAQNKPQAKRTKQSVKSSKISKDDDSDCEEVENTMASKKMKAEKKANRTSGGDSSVEELNSDSDFEVEVIKVASGPRRSSSSGEGGSAKKKSKKVVSSDSEESVEIIKTKGILDKEGTDSWLEVYCTSDKAWICVDCIHGHVKRPELCESYASKPITYIVAFDNEGSVKDITHRYDSKWMIGTQKLRVDSEWWQDTLESFRTKNTRRDREEDDQLQGKLFDKPLPTTISEYKGHPLYALKRHLLKFESLYPESAAILGYCRGEAVYSRECVHDLHTRQTWLKEAKVVRIGEKPYKMVKARPKRGQTQETEPSLEVFGAWQTEDYIPPPAVDGIVPRNEHGNVELFKECMLPKGTVHLRLVGLNRIARKLEIDCAPAMTGWDFHSGFCHPVLDGYVVCEEHEDLLRDAWYREQQEMEKKQRKKKEERALKNWKLLIKGVLIRERLNKRFQSDHGEASTSSPSKSKAKKSEKVAWPKNRLTAFEGDENNRLPFEKL